VGEPYPIVWWVMGVGGLGSVSQPMCTMNDTEVCQEATMGQRPPPPPGAFAHRSSRRTWPCPRRVATIGCALFGRLKRAQEVRSVQNLWPEHTSHQDLLRQQGVEQSKHFSLPTTTTKKADLRPGLSKGLALLFGLGQALHPLVALFCRRQRGRRLFATSPFDQPTSRKNPEGAHHTRRQGSSSVSKGLVGLAFHA
jgi:hypothetical protein